MHQGNRWVLLEHLGDPHDPIGRHFDLLLEDGLHCRTWRLYDIPVLDGPALSVTSLPAHNLSWLDSKGRIVSGNRGWAQPIQGGCFNGELPLANSSLVRVELEGSSDFQGTLEIVNNRCTLRSLPRINSQKVITP